MFFSSDVIFACVSCVVVALSVINPCYGIPLITLFVCELLWQAYHKETKLNFKFEKLHHCPTLVDKTAILLLQEWPSPEGTHGEPERNFVRTSSLYESSDKFPCHLVAYTPKSEVVAHVRLSISHKSNSKNYLKYVKMLQCGVPLPAVKNSAKLAGLRTDFLDNPGIHDRTFDSAQHDQHEGYMSSLLVKPNFRGHGLGKAMCCYAALVAKDLGMVRIVGGCADNVLPFYKKMGVCREMADKRDDMPSIRLGNSMFINLSNDVIETARALMSKYKW